MFLLLALVWTFVKGIVLAASALAFPITRKLYQPPLPVVSPWARSSAPNYSRIIEERLGCSVSWRVSRTRGYEFRVSYWHYYAPTLTSMWPAVKSVASLLQRQDKATMPDWWSRRSAAFGLSTSGPLPDQPHVTSSLALSLSGYYLRPTQKVRLVSSSSTKVKTSSSPLKQPSPADVTHKGRSLERSPPQKILLTDTSSELDEESETEESEDDIEEKAQKVKKA